MYSHRVVAPGHPLLAVSNSRFDVPHSRYNEIRRADLEAAGLGILIESAEAGLHMAVSPEGFRQVYFQGHPEYDANSLLKEYKREVLRHFAGERDLPPYPEHYLPDEAIAHIELHLAAARAARARGTPPPVFSEVQVTPYLDNTWTDTARAIFENWLGLVYQLTHVDRRIPFMEGVDPARPLDFLSGQEPRHP